MSHLPKLGVPNLGVRKRYESSGLLGAIVSVGGPMFDRTLIEQGGGGIFQH
jgi:hypothetical protein